MSHSLRRQLSLWIAGITLLCAMAAGIGSSYLAFREAQELQDDQLRQVALLVERSGGTPVDWVIPAGGANDDDPEGRLVVGLLRQAGRQRGLPSLPSNLPDGLQTRESGGAVWRLYVHTLPGGERLAVGKLTTVRDEVALGSGLRTLIPILLLIPLLSLLAAWVIQRGLQPVTRLSRQLDERDDANLLPLPTERVPVEIHSFVTSLNGLMRRLAAALDQQRRFIADAAHELRSPLTALSLQAENLEPALASPTGRERLAQLKSGLERSRQLLDQLLSLARRQSGSGPAVELSVDLVVRQVIEDAMPLATARQIDLGSPRLEPIKLVAPYEDLLVLVRNAVDNALRYTGAGGSVDVSLFREVDQLVFLVEDSGAGIPAGEEGRLFEPFYRVPGNAEPGSGLGLAIIRSIAERLGGRATLGNREGTTGARFCYRQALPLAL